jgi:3,4-dihydroxy 2-butanone 4-phosphate synthase/GTP cyclohydrolase II
MEMIAEEGRGVILYLRREAQGAELANAGRRAAVRPSTESSGRAMDFREYGIGAQILRDVGVGKIRLISNYPRHMVSLPGYGLEIVECVPIRVPSKPQRARRTKLPPPRSRSGGTATSSRAAKG